nr:MAG TPA: hypothetical protein [Caudoviricetes sp.]
MGDFSYLGDCVSFSFRYLSRYPSSSIFSTLTAYNGGFFLLRRLCFFFF